VWSNRNLIFRNRIFLKITVLKTLAFKESGKSFLEHNAIRELSILRSGTSANTKHNLEDELVALVRDSLQA